ncbi:helix-turn-helix domain-containing protein [Nonomuraea dietziae]|uniref:helix-turn-helix domain-containing protein n=1 Tax=Nonomuraea dietziae TaxID=65515 RepID=UPI0033BFBC00
MSRHRVSRHEMRRKARRMRRLGVQPIADVTDVEFAELITAGIARFLWRYRSEATPITIALLSVLAGTVLHRWYPTWWPTVALVTATTAGTLAIAGRWLNLTRAIERGYAAIAATLLGGWLTAATILGPLSSPLPAVLALGCLVLAIPWWAHRRRRARVRVERTLAAWPEISQAIGLAGSRIQSAIVDLWGYRTRIALARGQTVEDAIARIPGIESALGTRRGAVRIQPVPEKANRLELRVIETDPHADAISWPGPSVSTIHDPMELGVFEDGSPVRVSFKRRHALVGGVAGAGKSGAVNVLMGNLSACPDVIVWGIDLKRGMELLPWESCLDRVAVTPKEATALLKDAVRVLDGRAEMLAMHGLRVWEPAHDAPALIILIDEYAELVDDAPDAIHYADSIARRGRAVAETLIAATQRPSQKAMGNSAVRSQMDIRISFRVRERRDADLILGAGMHKSGWHADKLDAPGKFLLSAPEFDIPRRARTYLLTDDTVQRTAIHHADRRPALDAISLAALHEPPDEREDAVESSQQFRGRHARQAASQATEGALSAALRNAPREGVSVGDLMEAADMSRPTLYRRLAQLEDQGMAVQVSRGRWRATVTAAHNPAVSDEE